MGTGIRRALISVWDKQGLAPLAKELATLGIEMISTGGTAKFLAENGISVREVSALTGFSDLFDGRVKTLHPKIHGAILFRRGKKEHAEQARARGIDPIDMVVANLYPFEQVVGKREATMELALENIDIGGAAMLRSAAKNYPDVVALADPSDYGWVAKEIRDTGDVSRERRRELALKVFARTSHYDAAICRYFSEVDKVELCPDFLQMQFQKAYPLRYGENPSQAAAAYRMLGRTSIVDSKIHSGNKAMSYNNFLDADSAFGLIREFKDQTATVILKHNNPCGGAEGATLEESYLKAYKSDPLSSFGGIIAFSRKVDAKTALAIGPKYIEVVLAPGYDDDALEILKQKESRRILDVSNVWDMSVERAVNFRYITGGMLYQERDPGIYDQQSAGFPTKKKPSEQEKKDAYFAMKFAKHTKSNAIILAKGRHVVGVGAGQMSRYDSALIAVAKAQRNGFDLQGTVAASDAFMPFPDSLGVLAKEGTTCIVQPGGSVKDDEVIAAADEHGISMIFTGRRHFKH